MHHLKLNICSSVRWFDFENHEVMMKDKLKRTDSGEIDITAIKLGLKFNESLNIRVLEVEAFVIL